MTRPSWPPRSFAIAAMDPPPTRFLAGADVIGLAERKIAELQADIEPLRDLTTSLSYEGGAVT